MNGHQTHRQDQLEQPGDTDSASRYTYPDPTTESTPLFPWLSHSALIPPEDFPRAPGPLVFEGFVPSQQTNPQYGSDLPSTQQSNRASELARDHLPLQADQDGEAVETDYIDEEGQTNAESEYDSSAISGVYAGTRSRSSGNALGNPKKSRRTRRTGLKGRGGWSKGVRLGPRTALEPSEGFNVLHQSATNAFIDYQDHDKALDLILQAIAINPEVYSAHALLSEIYFAQGEDEKALAALFSGAHAVPRDPSVWQQVADVCLQRSTIDRQTALQQALYCHSRLLHIDPKDHDVRFQRAAVNRELGNYTRSLRDLQLIQHEMPRNSSVLRQLAEVFLEIKEIGKAKELYEEAFEFYRQNGMTDTEALSWSDINVYVEIFFEEQDYDEGAKALIRLARWVLGREIEAFWDDIADDREWDARDEPRRIETPGFRSGAFSHDHYGDGLPLELRVKLGMFRLKQGSERREDAIHHLEWLEPEDEDPDAYLGQYPDLFLQAALALYDVKDYHQALRYFEPLQELDIEKSTSFWLGIATSSYMCGKKDEAVQCYERAKGSDPLCAEAMTRLSTIYAERGNRELAVQNAREAMAVTGSLTQRTERRKYERKEIRLARKAAEQAFQQARKLPTLRKDADSNRADPSKRKQFPMPALSSIPDSFTLESAQAAFQSDRPSPGSIQTSIPNSKRKKPTASYIGSKPQDKILELYATLVSNTALMRAGDETARNTWMACAQPLTESFRAIRTFFPAERYPQFRQPQRQALVRRNTSTNASASDDAGRLDQDIPVLSVESSFPSEHHGIDLNAWLDIFLEHALLLARSGNSGSKEQCYTVITAAQDCAPWYQSSKAMLQIHACYVACTVALRDEATLFNKALRWFIRHFQLCTDAYRLFAALNLLYPREMGRGPKDTPAANAAFRSGPNQKYMFRQIISIDNSLPEDYDGGGEGPVPDFMRRPRVEVSAFRDDRDLGDYDEDELDEDGAVPTQQRSMKPKEMDVVLLSLYGHILYAGNSFSNALSYFYRAYTLDPSNPMILLSIALSYMHQITKRQSDDRHRYLLEGWAFFEEYAASRIGWAKSQMHEYSTNDPAQQVDLMNIVCREIEINRARCRHMLGMADLAVRGYQKLLLSPITPSVKSISIPQNTSSLTQSAVIRGSTEAMDIDTSHINNQNAYTGSGFTDDSSTVHPAGLRDHTSPAPFSMEAAYAIQTIYALNGNATMARSFTERYMVI